MVTDTTVADEIRRLHQEFEAWFAGTSDDFDVIERSLAPDFGFVSPNGDIVSRDDLLADIQEAHGARALPIRIENPVVLWQDDHHVLATYEEWHDHPEHSTARTSSVVFAHDPSRPRGLLWRHVHETWKVRPPDHD